MRKLGFVLACSALVWSGCSKDSKKEATAKAPTTESLWAMAPANTSVAVVVAGGTGQTLLNAWTTIETSISRHPMGGMIQKKLREELPPQIFDPQEHAKMGLDLSRGAALFVTKDEEPVMIMPVADRDAFRTALEGTVEEKDGASVDVFKKMRCTMVGDQYTCAIKDELLAQVGKNDAMAKRAADRADGMRGHVEVYVSGEMLGAIPDLPIQMFFSDISAVEAAIQIEPGGFTARAHLRAKPAMPKVKAFITVPDTLAKSAANTRPASMWRLRVPVADLVPMDKAADQMAPVAGVVAGFDPRRDLLDNITGEMVMYGAPGEDSGVVMEFGVKDGKRLKPLITTMCSLAKAGGAPLAIEMKDDTCTGTVDLAALKKSDPELALLPFDGKVTGGVSATDNAIRLSVTMAGTGAASRNVEPPALAQDLMTGAWNWAMWSSGTLASTIDPSLFGPLIDKDSEEYQAIMFGLWMLGHVSEGGHGIAVREDGVHVVMHLGTQWANPDDVLQAFETHLTAMLAGDESAAAKLDALVEKSPDTPLARTYTGAQGGAAGAAAVFGVIAAVAVPAFLKYQKKSKSSEARVFLHKLYDGARAHYLDTPSAGLNPEPAAFPAESVGPTPALGTCCEQGGKCMPNAALWEHPTWQALQFSVDDPHYYSYQYEVIDKSKEFVVRAIGDLDCDGVYSTFEMRGVVENGELSGTTEIKSIKATE